MRLLRAINLIHYDKERDEADANVGYECGYAAEGRFPEKAREELLFGSKCGAEQKLELLARSPGTGYFLLVGCAAGALAADGYHSAGDLDR